MYLFWGPANIFVGISFVRRWFAVTEVGSEYNASIEVFFVIVEISFIWFSRVRNVVEVFIQEFVFVFSELFLCEVNYIFIGVRG